MIRYQLKCRKGHQFEAWFRSSDDFDAQAKRKHVACPTCGSTSVSKAIMAPSVAKSTRSRKSAPDHPAAPAGAGSETVQLANTEQRQMTAMMRALRDEVLAQSEYVGPRFAEEARRIHNEETPARGIYGEATRDEVRELSDDGIDVFPLPVLPDDKN